MAISLCCEPFPSRSQLNQTAGRDPSTLAELLYLTLALHSNETPLTVTVPTDGVPLRKTADYDLSAFATAAGFRRILSSLSRLDGICPRTNWCTELSFV